MRKKIKQILMMIPAVCLLIGAPLSCGQRGQKIAFFRYKGGDTFISEMMEYMTARVPDGITYEVRDAGNSQSVQNQQIIELIDGGFDLFIINAVDRLACSSIVERCVKEGIPVLFFNREPLEDALIGRDVYYVGAAADSMGKKQAEMVADLFGGDFRDSKFDKNNDGAVQIVILKGEQGHQDAEKRTDNCISRFNELGFRTDVLGMEVADWNRRDGYEAMRRLYAQYGDKIELVFSNNDDMALGAIDFLLNEGVFFVDRSVDEQPFVIVGVDGTAVGLESIKQGLLYGTVNNDSVKQANAILTLTDYILNGRSFDDFPYVVINDHYIYIDGDIITLENVRDFTG